MFCTFNNFYNLQNCKSLYPQLDYKTYVNDYKMSLVFFVANEYAVAEFYKSEMFQMYKKVILNSV